MTFQFRAVVCALLAVSVSGGPVCADTIGLAWDPSPDADVVVAYRVYRDGLLIASTTSLGLYPIDVAPGTSALFAVTSYGYSTDGVLTESEPTTVLYTAFVILPLDSNRPLAASPPQPSVARTSGRSLGQSARRRR